MNWQERMRDVMRNNGSPLSPAPRDQRSRARDVRRCFWTLDIRAVGILTLGDFVEQHSADGPTASREEASAGRYSFRERSALRQPNRFDQATYNDVFSPLEDYRAARANRSRRRDSSSSDSRRSRRKRRRRSTRRGRRDDSEDDDDEEEEDDDVDDAEKKSQANEKDYASDSSDVDAIMRRIEEKEQAEKAQRQAPQHSRATRYALRYKNSDIDMNTSPRGDSSLKDARRGLDTEDNEEDEREDENEQTASDDDHGSGEEEDEDDDDVQEDEEESGEKTAEIDEDHEADGDEENDVSSRGRRYFLRQRSNSLNAHDSEFEKPITRRPSRGRHKLTMPTSRKVQNRRVGRDSVDAHVPETAPRYSLRDRSKVQRATDSSPVQDPSARAYADYAKRQASRGATGKTSRPMYSSSNRRSDRNTRRKRRNRRRSSSTSSSSSSDDMFKYYDSDEGGMRSSNGARRRGVASSRDNKRADISPVEVDRSITWESIGGLEKHIEALKEMVMLPLLYPEFYEKYNITPPSGVLFYGPPGTGKTLLARALANSCHVEDNGQGNGSLPTIGPDGTVVEERKPRHVTFYMRKGADCLSKWVGEAERQLRLLFEEAKRNEPSIIFFDEIDGLAPVRSAKQDQIHASIVSTLLALMDGLDSRGRVVVIGATNRLDAIDPALRRPGRFDRELGFKLPNIAERKKMIQIHTRKWKPTLSNGFAEEIAKRTVGYCGADMKALCTEAALCALRRVYPQVYGSQDKLLIKLENVVVSRGDFAQALKKITPASQRSVSSFAAPLPQAVKSLLEPSLTAVLKAISSKFPLFPLDANGNGGVKKAEILDEEDEDHDIYAAHNNDDCDVCHGDEGELLCCDACPGAFHPSCLPPDHEHPSSDSPAEWYCHDCVASSKPEELSLRRLSRIQHRQTREWYSLPHSVGFPRVLIAGSLGMGQSYVGAALLHVMEGVSHFTLDYPSLVADPNSHHPEEALVRRLEEARKCLPCVLYLPQVDIWWENTTTTMHATLKMMLMQMQDQANLPVLFLATTSSSKIIDLPPSLAELFRDKLSVRHECSVTMNLAPPCSTTRRDHFLPAFNAFAAPALPRRKRRRDEALEVLPLAPIVKKKREPTLEELLRIKELDMHCLRELRIFLGQVLDYCSSQRSYAPFHFPVDPSAVPDYYLIIKSPMDLSTMREKLNDGDYTCFEQFLDDVQLIVKNANIFNPKKSATRHIAHAAGAMRDTIESFGHRFRKEQGYDLFAKCREITKRLHTNPAFYGDVAVSTALDEAEAVARAARVASAPPLRTSARLRGIKAPEPSEDPEVRTNKPSDATTTTTDDWDDVEIIEDNVKQNSEQLVAPQWFDSSTTGNAASVKKDQVTAATEDGNEGDSELNTTIFKVGATVFVEARTFPGMNKMGGVGTVSKRNDDGTYNIKYILGGSEKNVSPVYVRDFTEDAVKASVKNQRPQDHIGAAGRVVDPCESQGAKSEDEMRLEFFEKLVWPNLVDDGWRKQEAVEVDDDGDSKSSVSFFSSDGTCFNSAAAVIEYINSNVDLSIKCFGKRVAETSLTEAVFGSDNVAANDSPSDEQATNVEPTTSSECPSSEELQMAATKDGGVVGEDNAEPKVVEADADSVDALQELVYDKDRMDKVLDDLVGRTANWTVEALRDELLLLRKLAYPYRFDQDRTKLMDDIESHVKALCKYAR
ncbi:hypothetical protein PINS_up003404 [Pythium insidiosum]|nr:hypothetical protein PINS_up003404 [Pythium insidiosum]